MKTTKSLYLPPGSVRTEDSQHNPYGGTTENDVALSGQFKSAEALRRKAYMRLARTIGISWLGCRRDAFKP